MQQVLPETTVQRFETRDRINYDHFLSRDAACSRILAIDLCCCCNWHPEKPIFEIDDVEKDDDAVEEKVSDFSRNNFGGIESPYLKPYIYNSRLFHKQYGIRREDDGKYMIGDSTLSVYNTSDISINGRYFKGTRGIW